MAEDIITEVIEETEAMKETEAGEETGETIRDRIRRELEASADPEYGKFHSRLLPGITGILGVRTPKLRSIARTLVKDGWQEYVEEVSCAWKEKGQGDGGVLYDEMILWGLCICGGAKDWDLAGEYTAGFVPAINNWAVCDIFCGSLKLTRKHQEEVWEFIQPYLQSDQEYELRFGVVMLLSHYVDEAHLDRALILLDRIRHEGYYVKMAVAWAVSVYFVKFPGTVMEYLKESGLDSWTYNKALQKITESYRVDKGTKEIIRSMKRKS